MLGTGAAVAAVVSSTPGPMSAAVASTGMALTPSSIIYWYGAGSIEHGQHCIVVFPCDFKLVT